MAKRTDSEDELLDAIDAVEKLLLSKIMPDNLFLGKDDEDDDDDDRASSDDARSEGKFCGGSSKSRDAGDDSSSSSVSASSSFILLLRSICRDALPSFQSLISQQSRTLPDDDDDAAAPPPTSGGFTSVHRAHHSSFVSALESELSRLLSPHGMSSLSSFRKLLQRQMSSFSGEGKVDDVASAIRRFQRAGETLEVLDVTLDFAHFAEAMVIRAEQWKSWKEGRGGKEGGGEGWTTGRRR